ncbi:AAEL008249-PC [Aedes aegypti]|uniref:Small integral membrane protein 8 n=1 Tax=Aedes aegypti TaxID=7159 RepID=A6KVL9_AEDAE|nr:AAEL008249-PD [Aedes aegypti]EAT39988.1 AAEL008249-PA [Aedes aegypti]EAT39989.1 AAEL008249-PB [Aedes aegypti]EAT39990.1 AAEL008249-PC [Aedes aegypti]
MSEPSQKPPPKPTAPSSAPGDGIRSMRSTNVFRAINFELYAKPNAIVMGIGLVAIGITFGYIAYMRSKYEGLGYYSAIQEDGKEVFVKRKSKWE